MNMAESPACIEKHKASGVLKASLSSVDESRHSLERKKRKGGEGSHVYDHLKERGTVSLKKG